MKEIAQYYKQEGGLGNFVQLTPAFQRLHEMTGMKIKVNFKKPYVQECFLDAPFIESANDPHNWDLREIISFIEHDRAGILNDYEFAYKFITGESYDYTHYTYVDTPKSGTPQEKPYIVLINGGAYDKEGYFQQKKMTKAMLDQIAFASQDNDIPLVFIGNKNDYETTESASPILAERVTLVLDDVRDALYQIKNARGVIANDTGLYHCACAMKKDVLVSTRVPLRPNKLPSRCIYTPNEKTMYLGENEWKTGVSYFMNKVM